MAQNKTVVEVVANETKAKKQMAIKKGRRILIRWSLFGVSVAILFGLLGWGLFWLWGFLFNRNPHFVFRELSFENTPHFTSKSIQEYMEKLGEKDGCIIGRTNLLNLDIRKLRSCFLASPIIEDVEIRHILPCTLDIRIKERTAIAYIANDSQVITGLMDKNGVVFPKVDVNGSNETLPYITNVQNADAIPMGIKCEDKYLLAAIDLIHEVNIRPQIDGAAYSVFVVRLNYPRERLECTLRPLFSNPVFPKGVEVWFPYDHDKMMEAFERFETILKIKLKEGSTLSFADVTLQYNVNTRD